MCESTSVDAGDGAGASPQALAAALVQALASVDPAQAADAELAEMLVWLSRDLERLQAQWSRHLDAFDARGIAAGEGLSSTGWLQHRCRMEPRQASQQAQLARGLRELPETRHAFEAGGISQRHAVAIHQAARKVGAGPVRQLESTLVDTARRVSADDLRRVTAHLQHAADPDGAVADAAQQRQRRWLNASTTFDGMVALDGLLDPEAGATVLTAIQTLSAPAAGTDDRSPAQRRADALTTLCRRQLDTGQLPAQKGQRPHLNVTITWETLKRELGSPAAHLTWAGPIPGESARRIACDADLTRIIIHDRHTSHTCITGPAHASDGTRDGPASPDRARKPQSPGTTQKPWEPAEHPPGEASLGRTPPGETLHDTVRAALHAARTVDPALGHLLAGPSQVLDVGRRTRTIPPGLRKAIDARDRHCQFPGCDIPAAWCACHHVTHWSHGGPTEASNLVLLCHRHHRHVHEDGWTMSKSTHGRPIFTPPTFTPSGASPLGKDPPEADPPDEEPLGQEPPGETHHGNDPPGHQQAA